jgi:ABC-type amino acid transport substrate-binding protein
MIKLAYNDPFPPFAINKEGGPQGLAIDILQEALARVSLKVVFVPMPMNRIQDLLHAEKADGIALFGINPERKKIYDYSEPYIFTGGALFLKFPNRPPSDLKELEDKRVATPQKGPLAGYIKKSLKVNLILVQDYLAALKVVLEDKADAAALNIHVGTYLANQLFPGKFTLPKKVFLEIPLAIAVSKGSQAKFLKHFNKGLKNIKKDGTYAKIIEKWSD